MAQNETAKFQTIQSLDNLNGALSLTGTLCDLIGQAPYQLNVFSAVTRHFTVAGDVFTSTKSFLESMEGETDEINGNYAAIQRAADACHRETRYLQGLCSAVTQSENKTEGYR
ncbi:hypothetical protein NW754_015375 [Fusarium falciforme]|nr:hypothetical protein NW754_015375 [Fusarium falciforme]